jgi:glycosyltransferase involved in cell wall biosynthesis
MVSFQAKLTAGLHSRGIEVTSNPVDEPFDAVLVVGGTRQIVALRRLARRGIPVVQRLDGMNWLHRRLPTGARHWLRAEIGNWMLAYIRERVTTRIVYQSEFVKDWWQRVHGPTSKNNCIIYNGVDLDLFHPNEKPDLPADSLRILMVEGNLQGGYELGLESAVALAEELRTGNGKIELIVAGQVSEKLRNKWNEKNKTNIEWAGVIPNDQLPVLYHNAHFLFSGDLNAACPNSVIEAMACGLPVLAFDTGALKELVSPQAGRVVPYGGDPWKLDPPDIPSLVAGAKEIIGDQTKLRAGARTNAEERFGLDRMVSAYIEALSG